MLCLRRCVRKFWIEGEWDGSMGKGCCHKAWQSESVSGIHMVGGGSLLPQDDFYSTHILLGVQMGRHAHTQAHTYAYTHRIKQNLFKTLQMHTVSHVTQIHQWLISRWSLAIILHVFCTQHLMLKAQTFNFESWWLSCHSFEASVGILFERNVTAILL